MRIWIHNNVLAHPLMSFTKYGTVPGRTHSHFPLNCNIHAPCTVVVPYIRFFTEQTLLPHLGSELCQRRFPNGEQKTDVFFEAVLTLKTIFPFVKNA